MILPKLNCYLKKDSVSITEVVRSSDRIAVSRLRYISLLASCGYIALKRSIVSNFYDWIQCGVCYCIYNNVQANRFLFRTLATLKPLNDITYLFIYWRICFLFLFWHPNFKTFVKFLFFCRPTVCRCVQV